jgi:hypothetical protein
MNHLGKSGGAGTKKNKTALHHRGNIRLTTPSMPFMIPATGGPSGWKVSQRSQGLYVMVICHYGASVRVRSQIDHPHSNAIAAAE